ncbi:MAG: ribosome small subunit-dependent GTPase A [Candidatus Pacebacteria bacterium]|nr:ribosome small subunit-dependent GTPase A [Candidatus Paceibacterota bacterium]MDD4074276.1 ribosome small subunit-dependent GTPase A [Candidatus Paceibacterota bacterium]
MNFEKKELESLGYNDFFEPKRKLLDLTQCSMARVIAEHKGIYRIKGLDGEHIAKITGRKMYDATKREDYPAVGDWVAITMSDEETAIINDIFPRKTILSKKHSRRKGIQIIATNIDVAFVVESVNRDFNLNRFERYFVLINEGKIKPVIILNKIDLISSSELKLKIDQIKERFNDIPVILTSTINEEGLDILLNYIEKGKTYCFLGSSGVGKSSLINKLLKKNKIKTKEISNSTGKGKHTTTSREIYFLDNGGIVIDNPGTREVGMVNVKNSVEDVFDKINNLSKNCKYADCTHIHESGCAVLKALEAGEIDREKYLNYIKLRKEAEHYEMDDVEKRGKDRKFGKFVKRSLEQLKEWDS